jgi:hypothetical protein
MDIGMYVFVEDTIQHFVQLSQSVCGIPILLR